MNTDTTKVLKSCDWNYNKPDINITNITKAVICDLFYTVAYQIFFGNYIDDRWKQNDKVYNINDLSKKYKNNIQLTLLKELFKVEFYRYEFRDAGEYNIAEVTFFNTSVEQLCVCTINNAM